MGSIDEGGRCKTQVCRCKQELSLPLCLSLYINLFDLTRCPYLDLNSPRQMTGTVLSLALPPAPPYNS
jgi:hypothetical protein